MIFDHGGNEVAKHQLEHEQILPQAGWVEHNPVEIWERTTAVVQTALSTHRLRPRRPGRARHHQPARDHRGLEPAHRPAVLQRDRLAGHPHRPDRPALDRDGRGDVIRRKAGLPPATYFSGGKIQWILENVDGVRAAAERGDAIFGNTDTLGAVEPHRRRRRRRARHRRHQRQPHHADGPRDPRLGRRAARLLRHPAGDAAARSARRRTRAGTARPGTGRVGGAVSAHRRPRRPAGGHRRPGLLRARRGQEHLRHRQLPAAEHRHRAGPLASNGLLTTVCYQFGDGAAGLRAGGLDRRDRLGRAVAARPARHHHRRGRERGAGPPGRRTTAASTSCPRSPACSRRTGAPTPAARSSGCPGSTPTPTWPGPRWRRSATRAATSSRRWSRTPGCTLDVLKVDGGVTANELCMQIQADVLGVPVSRPVVAETTALGAAYAAGLAVGFWKHDRRAARELERGQALGPAVDRGAARPRATPAGRRRSSAPWTGWTSTDCRREPIQHVTDIRAQSVLAHRRRSGARGARTRWPRPKLDVLVIGGGVVGAGAALDAVDPRTDRSDWSRRATSPAARPAGPAS